MLKKYDVSQYPVLSTFLNDDQYDVQGIMGPYGSGKSVACVHKILKNATLMPPCKDGKRKSRVIVIRTSYRELEDTTIRTWLEWVPENVFGAFKRQAKLHEVRFNDVELDVLFRSLDTDDDIRKLLSLELTGAWVNEAREIYSWTLLHNLFGRLSRFPRHDDVKHYKSYLIMDTNPPDTEHWWYKFAEVETPNGFKFYRQPSGLSPEAENRHHLDENYYKRLIAGIDPSWVDIYVNANYGFLQDGKRVYNEYQDVVHCKDNFGPVTGKPIIRGWDWGLTPACCFVQIDSKGRVLVFDELVSDSMGADSFSDIVLRHSKIHYNGYSFLDFGDPAGTQRAQTDEKTCFQILWNKGVMIEPGTQDPTSRQEAVRKALNSMIDGGPGFLLHPRCKTLRRGFIDRYVLRKLKIGGVGKYALKPDKNEYSHVHDALQYALVMTYGATIRGKQGYFDKEEEEEPMNERFSGRSQVCGY